VVEFEEKKSFSSFPFSFYAIPKKEKKEPTNLRVKKMGQNSNFPN
jgi:hypothetical protein